MRKTTVRDFAMDESPQFIGLDLAWSARNLSGGAVIHGGQLVATTGTLTDDAAILTWIGERLTSGIAAVVGIDAPLRVPNETGSRPCDRALSAAWRRFEAGALPANRRLLAKHGIVRGEALVAQLASEYGFTEQIPIPQRAVGRFVAEVYPHPAHVSLFDLPLTLKYKARGRSYATRWAEFERYCDHLVELQGAIPPLAGVADYLTSTLPPDGLRGLRGSALKRLEDTLDAITCAYIVAYLWYHGPERGRVYGTLDEGHILTPVPPAMALRLADNRPAL